MSVSIDRESMVDVVRAMASLSRVNPATFCEFVLRDERTATQIVNGKMHEQWHEFITGKPRCVIWASVESGKSQQITIGRTLWELGRDPSKRCLVISKTKAQAEKFTRPLRHYIESSHFLHIVFPHLKPGRRWTDGAFDVAGKPGAAKDASVEATGLDGNILGARYDWVVIDDLLDWETTRTRYQREKGLSWLRSTVFGRLTADAKVVFLANAWERDDAAHVLASEGWESMRSPLVDPDTNELMWEERWPRDRVEEWRKGNPAEFDRQIMCIARRPGDQRFKDEWIDACLARGAGRTLVYALGADDIPEGATIVTGVDLGVGLKQSNDLTAIATVMCHKDGTRELLWLESGRWTAPEIVKRVLTQHERFGSVIFVESNAAQDFLVQFARLEGGGAQIRRFNTGRTKWHPSFGVEGIAAEMSAGRWIFPSGTGTPDNETRALMDDMRFFDPASHTGDRLMALWIAREAVRRSEFPHRMELIDHNEAQRKRKEREDAISAELWDGIASMVDLTDDIGEDW